MKINVVYNEDCLMGMSRIADKSVDMILCDLPYGTTKNKWDIIIPFTLLWGHYERIIKDNGAIVLTSQQPFTTDLINSNRKLFRYETIWEKTQKQGFLDANKKPLRSHENISVFYKKQPTYNPQKHAAEKLTIDKKGQDKILNNSYSDYHKKKTWKEDGTRYPTSVIKISNWNGALFGKTNNATKHPTQKPVALFEYLIKTYTNEGETVLDNCMGLFTTAVACLNTGRNYIGFEKEEKYFKIGTDRVEKHKQKMFEERNQIIQERINKHAPQLKLIA